MQKRHPGEGGAVLLGGERVTPTKNHPEPQPASVTQLRFLHLIASHHVRPAMALALASLAYGEAR